LHSILKRPTQLSGLPRRAVARQIVQDWAATKQFSAATKQFSGWTQSA
jgi:hypothetical protein